MRKQCVPGALSPPLRTWERGYLSPMLKNQLSNFDKMRRTNFVDEMEPDEVKLDKVHTMCQSPQDNFY